MLMLVVLALAIELPYRCEGVHSSRQTKSRLRKCRSNRSSRLFPRSSSALRFRRRRRASMPVGRSSPSAANAIGTTRLAPTNSIRGAARRFRHLLADDTAAGLAVYQGPYDRSLTAKMNSRVDRDEEELWSIVSSALRARERSVGLSLLTQSLNTMIDVVSQERQALKSHGQRRSSSSRSAS